MVLNKLMIWYIFQSIAYFKSNIGYGTIVFVITLRMKKKCELRVIADDFGGFKEEISKEGKILDRDFLIDIHKKLFPLSSPAFLTTFCNYFDSVLDYQKAAKLYSPCLVRCVCFLISKTSKHHPDVTCICFKCKLARMFITILCCRRHLALLSIMSKNNCLISDRYICDYFRKLKIQMSVPQAPKLFV